MSEELKPIMPPVRPILNPDGKIFGPILSGVKLVMPSDPLWFLEAKKEPFILPKFVVKIPEPWVKEREEPPKDNPPEDYGSDLITIENEEIMAYTFYIDSVAWDDTDIWRSDATQAEKNACYASMDKSGDGSKENPWRNVCYALDKLNCVLNQRVYGKRTDEEGNIKTAYYDRCPCVYIRLVLTGTINYTVCAIDETARVHYFNIRTDKPLVIFDGEQTKIEVERDSSVFYYYLGVGYCTNSYFYNCTVTVTAIASTDHDSLQGVYLCENSYFYNCAVTISSSYHRYSNGAFYCTNSYFYNCTVTVITTDGESDGVTGCTNSYFYNCTVTVTATDGQSHGVASCRNSYFYNCTITSSSYSSYAFSVSNCTNSYFYNCTITSSSSYHTFSVYSCPRSYFYNCTITSYPITSYSTYSVGVTGCENSYFYNCTVTTSSYCSESYGVTGCENSYFYNCTITSSSSSAYSDYAYSAHSHGVARCHSSYFYNCTITSSYFSDYSSYYTSCGVFQCYNSYFYKCTVTSSSNSYFAYSIGVDDCSNSYFYNCTIDCVVESYGEYYYICGADGYNTHFINTSYPDCASNHDTYCFSWDDREFYNWCYCNCKLTYD